MTTDYNHVPAVNYKHVPAVEKCFSILELMAEEKRSFGYSEIVKDLSLNKSTVFNILHTLDNLNILEKGVDGRFRLGSHLFLLGNAAAGSSGMIQTVHPYLRAINMSFKVSAFFGIRSGNEVVVIDKADQAQEIKVSSDIGRKISIFAGVAGKAMLAQLSEEQLDDFLSVNTPPQYTSRTITDPAEYKKEIQQVSEDGIAYDREEYIEGLVAVAIPVLTYRSDLQAGIWAVGLKQRFKKDAMTAITEFLLETGQKIKAKFELGAESFE